eukprot:Tamp_19729.p2 GENE.Tamp_19729~~Tamp_19729.p2  ORF type:complete len:104 (+),score=6.13 Tamp_19729:185-496(+)
MSKAALAAAAHVLTSEEYDSNPFLDTHEFFDWHGDLATVLEHVVPNLQVDTLVLNSGLWGELTDADHVDGIFAGCALPVLLLLYALPRCYRMCPFAIECVLLL